MKDSTKKYLRQQVLEVRVELRGYVKELQTINKERDRVISSIRACAADIQAMQEDCGDPVEIDPQNPILP